MLGPAACSGASTTTSATETLSGDPASYLLRLDDLALPGFTVQEPPTRQDAAMLARGNTARARRLEDDHLEAAAAERFFRPVASLASSAGPVDILATSERFASDAGASSAYGDETAAVDAVTGSIPLSTGRFADAAHASLLTAADHGVTVAQTTLVWRRANLVCVLVVRERLAGSPLNHALQVATPMLLRQGASTPTAT